MNVDQVITTVIDQLCPGMFKSRYIVNIDDVLKIKKFSVVTYNFGRTCKQLQFHLCNNGKLSLITFAVSLHVYVGDREWKIIDDLCVELNKQLAIYKMVMI